MMIMHGIDVKDKIVIVHEIYSRIMMILILNLMRHSPFRQKATVARDKGAAGIIFVNRYDANKTMR
ncbi:MAG: hypothetical protein MZV64_25415 [Ignavibacteriales bacterium]|nr:hypothetical protein [Ignavibacteriales bacterium]